MAKLFEGTLAARAQTTTLETSKTKGGHIGVSAKFKFEPKQKAKDEHGRDCDVSGNSIVWYGTVSSDKTRTRMIESLVSCGMSEEDAELVIASVEEGEVGKIDPAPPGFGSKVCDLVCEIETYEGKTSTRVKWINEAGATGPKRNVASVKIKFGGKSGSASSSAGNTNPASGPTGDASDVPYDEV